MALASDAEVFDLSTPHASFTIFHEPVSRKVASRASVANYLI